MHQIKLSTETKFDSPVAYSILDLGYKKEINISESSGWHEKVICDPILRGKFVYTYNIVRGYLRIRKLSRGENSFPS